MKKRLLLFGVGILAVLLVINMFGFREVITVLQHANPEYLGIALGLQFIILLVLGLRQRLLGGFTVPFWKSFRIAMSGNFVNLIVPGPAIGGEPLKAYMLEKEHGSSKAIAVIAVDDFVEILGTLIVMLWAVVFFVPTVAPDLTPVFALFIVVVILIMTGAMKILLTPRWLKKIATRLIHGISKYQKIEEKDYAKMFYNAFTLLLKKKATMAAAILLTLGVKCLEFLILGLTFRALGIALPWRDIVILWCVIVVFLYIPWLPGSLGLVEFGATSALVLFGIQESAAASGIILNRFISFWFVLLVGAAAIYYAKTRGELPKSVRLSDVSEKSFKKQKRK